MITMKQRLFSAFAGLYGAGGIAAYAAASHLGGYYQAVAPILLGNACALLVLSLAMRPNLILRLAGVFITLGVALFTTDIMMLQFAGTKLFTYAAPMGGTITILGWLFIFLSAFVPVNETKTK